LHACIPGQIVTDLRNMHAINDDPAAAANQAQQHSQDAVATADTNRAHALDRHNVHDNGGSTGYYDGGGGSAMPGGGAVQQSNKITNMAQPGDEERRRQRDQHKEELRLQMEEKKRKVRRNGLRMLLTHAAASNTCHTRFQASRSSHIHQRLPHPLPIRASHFGCCVAF